MVYDRNVTILGTDPCRNRPLHDLNLADGLIYHPIR